MKTDNIFPSVQFHDDYIEVTTNNDAVNLAEQARVVEKMYTNLNGKRYQVVPDDDGRLSAYFKATMDKVEEAVKQAEDRIQHSLGILKYKIEERQSTIHPSTTESTTKVRTKVVPDGVTVTAVGTGQFEDLVTTNSPAEDLIASIPESDHEDIK